MKDNRNVLIILSILILSLAVILMSNHRDKNKDTIEEMSDTVEKTFEDGKDALRKTSKKVNDAVY